MKYKILFITENHFRGVQHHFNVDTGQIDADVCIMHSNYKSPSFYHNN